MSDFDKKVIKLYNKGWTADRIAIKFAVQINTIQIIIYKYRKDYSV